MLVAVALTGLPVAAGVLVLGDDQPAPTPPEEPAYTSTALADFDTSTVTIDRAPFCDGLPEEALTEALPGDVGWTVTTYDNGERARLGSGPKDVAHEYGCRVDGAGLPDGALEAWLFAPPVTRSRAAELVEEAVDAKGCSRQEQAPAYGAPSVAVVCPAGKRTSASFRGLFGDAWLACSVTARTPVPEQERLDRAGRWCVAVAQAASSAASARQQ